MEKPSLKAREGLKILWRSAPSSHFAVASIIQRITIKDDILQTFDRPADVAQELGTSDEIGLLRARVLANHTDANWLRETYRASGALSDVVRQQSALWMTGKTAD